MDDHKTTEVDLLNDMTEIRAANNLLWMSLVKIALKADPTLVKTIINAIQANDQEIIGIWQALAK